MNGKLYLVATPIGNLEDITLRALRILKEVDLIAAEDTRNTLKLLNHFEISKPLISYHRHNEEIKVDSLIEKIKNGENIAVVSDAGTPGISDPGEVIAKEAIKNNIEVIPIPGACAAINALIASGLDTTEFTFFGFLPLNKKIRKERLAFIESLKQQTTNSRQFLLETIPNAFKQNEASLVLSDAIENCKAEYDKAKTTLLDYVVSTLKTEFKCTKNASLKSGLSEWYNSLNDTTIQHLFNNNENKVLALISSVGNDENAFAERIGKALVGLRLDDWNNSLANSFKEKLRSFISTIEDYDKENHDIQTPGSESYSIVFKNGDGTEKVRSFEKVEYSKWADLLYQDISGAIEDIGQSVTEQEKRQVLLDILSKLCD